MSIEANVSRKFVINSHNEFYRFIKNKDNLLKKYMEFRILKDHIFLSENGCPCNTEEHQKVASEIYSRFNEMNQDAFKEIKEIMNCSSIIFKLNNEFLFEL